MPSCRLIILLAIINWLFSIIIIIRRIPSPIPCMETRDGWKLITLLKWREKKFFNASAENVSRWSLWSIAWASIDGNAKRERSKNVVKPKCENVSRQSWGISVLVLIIITKEFFSFLPPLSPPPPARPSNEAIVKSRQHQQQPPDNDALFR